MSRGHEPHHHHDDDDVQEHREHGAPLTEDELEALVTRDSMIGVAKVRA